MDFFDKLGKKATEVYNTTAEKTNKITREMKLKSLMNDDKSKINQLYQEIGKIIYEKHNLGEEIDINKDIAEQCSKIDAYSKEIKDTLQEIRVLKDLKVCEECDKEININVKFCPHCGTEQKITNTENDNDTSEQKAEIIVEVIGEPENKEE